MAQRGEIPESFGQYLKRERELREISIEEIAAYTRIKPRALEAIEQDDFSALPPLAFVRAFIRCYSDYIGLNVQDAMLRFDSFVQNRFPEMTGETPSVPAKPKPKQRYLPLIFAVSAVLLILFLFWLQRPPPAGKKPVTSPDTTEANTIKTPETPPALARDVPPPAPTEPEPAPPPEPQPRPEPEPEPTDVGVKHITPSAPWTSRYREPIGPPRELAARAPEPEPGIDYQSPPATIAHDVTMKVDEKCWIWFQVDNDEPSQTILDPDQEITFQAVSSVKITIGNPDGVASVTYNGQKFDFMPKCSPWHLNFPNAPGDNPCAIE